MNIGAVVGDLSAAADWLSVHWAPLVLTGEMVGAVLAIKMGAYRLGIGWLVAAVATVWVGCA